MQNTQRRFTLGRVMITPHASATLPPADIAHALAAHARGEAGNLVEERRDSNEESLRNGGPSVERPILSGFTTELGAVQFFVISDDAGTTVFTYDDLTALHAERTLRVVARLVGGGGPKAGEH